MGSPAVIPEAGVLITSFEATESGWIERGLAMADGGLATPYAVKYTFDWNESKVRWDAKATTYIEVDVSRLTEQQQRGALLSIEKAHARWINAGTSFSSPRGAEVWLTFDLRVRVFGAKDGVDVPESLEDLDAATRTTRSASGLFYPGRMPLPVVLDASSLRPRFAIPSFGKPGTMVFNAEQGRSTSFNVFVGGYEPANLTTMLEHEFGHHFGLPDQYGTSLAPLDPTNQMGSVGKEGWKPLPLYHITRRIDFFLRDESK
jgi:hypothetical protein